MNLLCYICLMFPFSVQIEYPQSKDIFTHLTKEIPKKKHWISHSNSVLYNCMKRQSRSMLNMVDVYQKLTFKCLTKFAILPSWCENRMKFSVKKTRVKNEECYIMWEFNGKRFIPESKNISNNTMQT